jgi:hypothetical protein
MFGDALGDFGYDGAVEAVTDEDDGVRFGPRQRRNLFGPIGQTHLTRRGTIASERLQVRCDYPMRGSFQMSRDSMPAPAAVPGTMHEHIGCHLTIPLMIDSPKAGIHLRVRGSRRPVKSDSW